MGGIALQEFLDLFSNVTNFTWQEGLMIAVGCLLIYLAIVREMEPTLLLPMGFGAVLVNLPFVNTEAIETLFNAGIATELFPLLLFIGIGAMIDFGPLLSNPKMMLFGAAAQFGIFFTLIVARLIGFDLKDAASIAIIGAADGPTSIYVSQALQSAYQGAIMVAAYSYMALVPIVQPPIIRLITTKKERQIRMAYTPGQHQPAHAHPVPDHRHRRGRHRGAQVRRADRVPDVRQPDPRVRRARLPQRQRPEPAGQPRYAAASAISVAFRMKADAFVTLETLAIIALGLVAFVFDTVGGVLFAKLLNLFSRNKVNPMIGAAGISAFPMASRVVHKMGREEDPYNYLLMHAAGANVSGTDRLRHRRRPHPLARRRACKKGARL